MAKDPYRYFRIEAKELLEGLMQGALQLEQGSASSELIARLLRLAHTFKGAARVVRQSEIAERAHSVEGILSTRRDGGPKLSAEESQELVRLLDEIGTQLQTLDQSPASAAPVASRPVADDSIETLRIEISDMDTLMRGVVEIGAQLEGIRKRTATAARHSAIVSNVLVDDLERLVGEVREIQDVAHRLRLTPASTVFPSLSRAVRDAAQTLGKRAEFEATGGDIRLDASVLLSLRDALTHVVRNSVVHGIEDPEMRAITGKPSPATVRLLVERRGNRVAFVCSDDGRGVDIDAVRRKAVQRGLVSGSQAEVLSDEQVLALLRAGGLSTSANITELAGRGIGLDVARETALRLKGALTIKSDAGKGTSVEIQVPISIASMEGLVLEAAGVSAVIPLDAVLQTLRLDETHFAVSAEAGTVLFQDNYVPFLALDHVLSRSGTSLRNRRRSSVVIVQVDNRRVAIGADRLRGTTQFVMRPLSAFIIADPVIAGASLDAEGHPQLVLDPRGLIDAADKLVGRAEAGESKKRAPILVTDDSLTTRMLEQSILESAGYDVHLAVSAEEALVKARSHSYALFIVDVEMPGMDGFEFVAETRADPVLRNIPAILVTSRNATEDLHRGEQVGAAAYIVKSEFDQDRLLQIIRTLIG